MILDIFSVTIGLTFIGCLVALAIDTIIHDDNPDHVYDEELA